MRQMNMNQAEMQHRRAQLGKLALVAVAVPVATRVLRGMGRRMQERRAHEHMAGMMHTSGTGMHGRRARW